MKATKMMFILGLMIFLTGCSSIEIKEVETTETETGPVVTTNEVPPEVELETAELSIEADDNNSEDNLTEPTNITVEVLKEDTTLTAEEKALTEKVKTLIDDRKVNSEETDGLTEDDIQLMEDILKEIVDGSN